MNTMKSFQQKLCRRDALAAASGYGVSDSGTLTWKRELPRTFALWRVPGVGSARACGPGTEEQLADRRRHAL